MTNFYEDLHSFKNYDDLMNPKNFTSVPKDWFVLITDIQGSTLAVKEGRYRDVNFVGSMPIASLLNSIQESIPFVFGGDGATLLIPPSQKQVACEEIQKCIFLAKEKYNLNLRARLVPLKDLVSPLEVAKYELSQGNFIAQFRGGGIDEAERLVKQSSSSYLLNPLEGFPSLDGLTCRWAPLPSTRGFMMTLIIKEGNKNYKPFEDILKEIQNITKRTLKDSSPVELQNLTTSWPPPIHLEAKAVSKEKNYIKTYLKTFCLNVFVYAFVRLNLNTKDFSTSKYKKEIKINSDFKKFDDVLRLVLDCSKKEVEIITEYLNSLEEKGIIQYGKFLSKKAVMTCLVFSTDQDHIHFIDGSEGGYTNAAFELKNKVKTNSLRKVA